MKQKRVTRAAKRVTKRKQCSKSAGNSVGAETYRASMGPSKLAKGLATVLKAMPPSLNYINGNGVAVGLNGVQTVTSLNSAWGVGGLAYNFSTGTQAQGVISGGATSRTVPLYCTQKFKIKNQEANDAYCVIYDCTPKNDINTTPMAAWQAGFADTQGNSLPAQSLSDSFIGCTPMQSERFRATWRILKTTKFMLAPGAQHMHTQSIKGNRVLSDERLQAGLSYIKGWSLFSFIVVYGGPVDSGSGSTVVTTGTTKLIWTSDYVSAYKVFQQNSTNLNYNAGLVTTCATETVMNEANGVSQLDAAA